MIVTNRTPETRLLQLELLGWLILPIHGSSGYSAAKGGEVTIVDSSPLPETNRINALTLAGLLEELANACEQFSADRDNREEPIAAE